jgi:hypothetical protein
MQKLNLNNCDIVTEHFVPSVINDKNLYDDITIETGTITCHLLCPNNKEKIEKSITKFLMILEAFNDGYVKSIRGYEYGLEHVFGIIGTPKYVYHGGNDLEVIVKIASLVYNPYLHMNVVSDCLSAGAVTALMPDSRKYFYVNMDDRIVQQEGLDSVVNMLEPQRDIFKKTIVDNMRPL